MTNWQFTLPLTLALAILAGAAPSASQGRVEPLRTGQPVTRTLSTGGWSLPTGEPFHAYRFPGEAGRLYRLSLRASGSASSLAVFQEIGPLPMIVENDEADRDGDAEVWFRARESRTYMAVVAGEAGGAYTLELREVGEHPAVVRPLAIGDSARGVLNQESARDTESNAPYALYTFRAGRGDRLRTRVRADSLDLTAAIGRMVRGAFVPLAGPDDEDEVWARRLIDTTFAAPYGARRATRLDTIPEDGEYAVRVLADGPGGAGAYTLRLSRRGPPPAPRPAERVAAGREVDGTLAESDDTDGEKPHHDWIYPAVAGERLTITMRSAEFDTDLRVGTLAPDGTFRQLARNDDHETEAGEREGLSRTDSRVVLTAPVQGNYVIRAAPFGEETGEYRLAVASRAPVVHTLHEQTLIIGQRVSGSLEPTDAALEADGSPYEQWTFRTQRADERIRVTLTSCDFDTMLSLGTRRRGIAFEEFTSDDDARDDAPGMHVSRLVAVLPEPGEYVIRVNTFGPDESGTYSLIAEREPAW